MKDKAGLEGGDYFCNHECVNAVLAAGITVARMERSEMRGARSLVSPGLRFAPSGLRLLASIARVTNAVACADNRICA